MKVLLDTSVLIPALVPTLPQHEKAAPHLESVHRGETALIISSHALAECYSSLTALPVSPAVTPGQARRLVEENIVEAAEKVVGLGRTEYLNALQRAADRGLESGAVYDVLHVLCAEKASADELRTFNGRDFRRMPPEEPTTLEVL
ncbi:putative nucleic acid-binding protein [Salinibacter ruber]|uniref:type II toxin-antitoxin system VapC family toxin n=1 Tax=Salinibacter ruber TaxID=146919 RepID=UPI002167E324|nr:PIN domain-containing protein [Salinibacter ruber]MCS3650096.1 putative nucleic acid-binding protein [Salinibacter ruber]MCS3653349.1 putative nucleic acid-binding protein [Salinibacter ruber]